MQRDVETHDESTMGYRTLYSTNPNPNNMKRTNVALKIMLHLGG